jgi:hypothetical protein
LTNNNNSNKNDVAAVISTTKTVHGSVESCRKSTGNTHSLTHQTHQAAASCSSHNTHMTMQTDIVAFRMTNDFFGTTKPKQ